MNAVMSAVMNAVMNAVINAAMNSVMPSPMPTRMPMPRTLRTRMTPVKDRSRVTGARRGTALVLVLIAVVVLAVLSSGAILGSLQELRSSHNEQMAQRALTTAEYGLNQQLASWPSTRSGMAFGAVDSLKVAVGTGDTAAVSVMRLNSRSYWIVSVGRTNRSSGRLEAQRQVSLLVNVSVASTTAGAALTAKGQTTDKGSSTVSGRESHPTGWTDCAAGRDTFAIARNPGGGEGDDDSDDGDDDDGDSQQGASAIVGGTYRDPNAAKLSTYENFGSETWSTLVAKANVSSASQPASPAPAGNSTTCTKSSSNWGEPYRNGAYIAGCTDYYPIIYASNNLKLTGGRGQGVLLVNGNLDVSGNFYFTGLIVVTGNVKVTGTSVFRGAVLAEGNIDTEGNSDVRYSSCAVGNSLKNLSGTGGGITRAGKRSWVQLY